MLYEIYEKRQVFDPAGGVHKLDQAANIRFCEALYNLVVKIKPTTVVEVGMANGCTSTAILAGLDANKQGKLISIDPGQTSQWKNCGRETVRRAGLESRHEFIEDYDYNALPMLLARGVKPELGYIDGWHTFDYCLLDWFYIEKMMAVGGIIGFNDSHFRAVHKCLKFVQTHRHYEEIDVGLPKVYDSRIPVIGSIIKRIEGRNASDRYFKKLDTWEPYTQDYFSF